MQLCCVLDRGAVVHLQYWFTFAGVSGGHTKLLQDYYVWGRLGTKSSIRRFILKVSSVPVEARANNIIV